MLHRPHTLVLSVALALALGCSPSGTAAPQPPDAPALRAADPDPAPQILRLVLRLTATGIEAVSVRQAAGRVSRRDPHADSPWFLRGLDRQGRTLFERGFAVTSEVRGEIVGDDGRMQAFRRPIGEPLFTVAVPMAAGLHSLRFFRADPDAPRATARLLGEVRP